MEVRNKLNVSVALVVFALVSMLLTGPVVGWLVGHRNIGILDAKRVKAILMAAGFVLLFGSFIADYLARSTSDRRPASVIRTRVTSIGRPTTTTRSVFRSFGIENAL
jgi:hypothetical protein